MDRYRRKSYGHYFVPSKNNAVYQSQYLDMPFQIRVKRAGIVPIVNGHFCFGVDKQTQNYTDFGGGVKHHESWIDAAIREFNEESNYIFENINVEYIQQSNPWIVYNQDMLIIFLPMSGSFEKLQNAFTERCPNDEICVLIFVSKSELKNMILDGTSNLYQKIRLFLWQAGNLKFID